MLNTNHLMRHDTCGSRHSGFSLLEILIAVAILSTSLVILLSGQGSSYLFSERAERITVATFLSRQRMAEIEIELEEDLAKNKLPDEVEKMGEFEDPFEDFRWKYTIKKVEIPVAETGEEGNALVMQYVKGLMQRLSDSVREVQMIVLWGDGDIPEEDQPQVTVTTHIMNLQ